MPRWTRTLLWTAGGTIAFAAIVFLVLAWFVRRPFPDVRGRERVPGIVAEVEIFRDDDGVPHIYATSEEDLYFGQGYVHAQDRFWQMEFWRRIGAGRLSELLGESAVDQDRYLRTMGFFRVAEEEYEQLPRNLQRLLDAYARGVNAYVLERKPGQIALEFALLSLTGVEVEIEPWTGVNSLSWAKVMALDLGANMGDELTNLSLLRFGGTALAGLIRTPYRDDMPFIVTMDEVTSYRERAGLPPLPEPTQSVATIYSNAQGAIGSNNWVIGPERTATGMPLLANDMHLAVQIPSIWYEVGMHLDPDGEFGESAGGDGILNLRGFSFAGVPGVIAGQNDHVAWGMTNIGGDVQDLYLERINPANTDQYWDGESWQDMEIRLEEIVVEGEDEPIVHRVRSTPRGPVITDLPQLDQWFSYSASGTRTFPEGIDFHELSLRWTALQPETLWQAVTRLNRAEDVTEVVAALESWESPGQNLVFADDEGNIGYQSTGSYFDRHPQSGRAPTPAWLSTPEGLMPFENYPAVINPGKGYIVTANNPVVPPEYPYPLGVQFANGYRAKRIVEMIEAAGSGIDAEAISAIHGDTFSRSGFELLPFVTRVDPAGAYETWLVSREDARSDTGSDNLPDAGRDLEFLEETMAVLEAWDYSLDPESAGAAAFGFIWKELLELTFRDEAPDHAWPIAGVSTLETSIHSLLEDPGHRAWDNRFTGDVVEQRDDILSQAFVDGAFAAREELGGDPDRWQWGDLHTIEFRNATLGESGIGLIERLFNRGPYPLSGGASTVNVAHWSLREPFAVTSIASERAIYDLADPSASLFTHPTGQSGHAFHRHYMGFFEEWRTVEYHPARWTRDEVEESAGRRRILLQPELD